MKNWKGIFTLALALMLIFTTAACSNSNNASGNGNGNTAANTNKDGNGGSEPAPEPKTVKVAFVKWGEDHIWIKWMNKVKKEFEEKHPGVTVELIPVPGQDFQTKFSLMMMDEKTAPDVLTEDTFLVNSDVAAGNLSPLDDKLAAWEDWSKINPAVHEAVKGADGKLYGVPFNTDTRGLYYNTNIFKEAGIPVPWQPKNWNEILDAAAKIKTARPDVVPFWANAGKATGEGTTMQTFEMLLYGTDDTLYDYDQNKWVVESPGIVKSLQFVQNMFSKGLGPKLSQILTPQAPQILEKDLLRKEKVGIVLNGNWMPGPFREGGTLAWPEMTKVYQLAAMPTEQGQGKGFTSMSGGWALSVPAKAQQKDLAFEFVTTAMNYDNHKFLSLGDASLTPRTDLAEDPEYKDAPGMVVGRAAEFIQYTNFRPAFAEYPSVSTHIQEMVEVVAAGKMKPEEAMKQFSKNVVRLVGEDKVIKK
ncbi:extracellular solute-binding protein [Paenibacillus gansuensis]|uniref:Extracellular solute-binding protein n=1 Tax=Paenibacillus gansuensis TaxID=306542 RepID=A0ABW5P8H0_9BACL